MRQEAMIQCCGDPIAVSEGCNPAPMYNGDGARCCHRYDRKYVIPERIKQARKDRIALYV